MKQGNIEQVVEKFNSLANSDHRYASFDFCYNYFYSTNDLTKDMEKSCFVLAFYLASWGMFRSSSRLLSLATLHSHASFHPHFCSLGPDIFRKRYAKAAFEIQTGNVKIIDVALKYGYESPDAFSRHPL